MAGQALQSSRFEFKYIVDEETAIRIRQFLTAYLEPDEYLLKFGGIGYPVCSLYLDNSGLLLYSQTMQGQKNRFKLRIRFYDDDPHSPAFLEIKRRETDIIKKKRAPITKEGARLVLAAHHPSPSYLYGRDGSTKSLDALEEFCRLRDRIDAQGCTYVCYHREAYVSPDTNYFRVTFDRELEGGVYIPTSQLEIPKDTSQPKLDGVILELKFTDRPPNWMVELARVFGLQRISVPKYCYCVDALRADHVPLVVGDRHIL